jgi:hypothetical protein
MGVNCRILLPAAVRIDDVADVMAALAGFAMQKRHFSNSDGGWSAGLPYGDPRLRVESAENLVECARIHLTAPDGEKLVDGETGHYCLYHFEGSGKGERLLMPRSTPFWIAMGRGLVDFFGGTLDYSDCDAVDVDYKRPARKDIHVEDGDEWSAFQERKLAVKPITKADLAQWKEVAAY